jgi:type VI secretion system protein ImpA
MKTSNATVDETTVLLDAVAAAEPCGPDLRGSLAFAELQRLGRGKPAQYVGDRLVVPAEDPPWPAVIEAATALLARSKDLRLAVLRARGLMATGAWAGLAVGLATVRDLLQQHWVGVHPRLDLDEGEDPAEGEGGDPTLRLNSLAELGSDEVIAGVRQLALVSAPRAGRCSLREPLAPGLLEAALAEADPQVVRATAAAIEDARQATAAIERVLSDKLGARAITLGRLGGVLAEAAALLVPRPGAKAVAVVPAGVVVADGAVGSRPDVVSALEAICRFYRTHEPSSPIPLLLERARRLVDKSFVELVEDLTPDGLGQLHLLRGPHANQNNNAE